MLRAMVQQFSGGEGEMEKASQSRMRAFPDCNTSNARAKKVVQLSVKCAILVRSEARAREHLVDVVVIACQHRATLFRVIRRVAFCEESRVQFKLSLFSDTCEFFSLLQKIQVFFRENRQKFFGEKRTKQVSSVLTNSEEALQWLFRSPNRVTRASVAVAQTDVDHVVVSLNSSNGSHNIISNSCSHHNSSNNLSSNGTTSTRLPGSCTVMDKSSWTVSA